MFKGKCPHRPRGPSGGRTLQTKPQASGECERTSSLGIRAGVLGCGRSSVRFRGQENAQKEMRGARRKNSALLLCPSRPPPCLQRGNSLPVPEGSKSARDLIQGARRRWGSRCTKTVRSGHPGTGGYDKG